jgi:hypothetical protein
MARPSVVEFKEAVTHDPKFVTGFVHFYERFSVLTGATQHNLCHHLFEQIIPIASIIGVTQVDGLSVYIIDCDFEVTPEINKTMRATHTLLLPFSKLDISMEEMAKAFYEIPDERSERVEQPKEDGEVTVTEISGVDGITWGEFKSRMENLINLRNIQSTPGNYDCNEYMRGMANGLILAVHTMLSPKKEIAYIDPPEKEIKHEPFEKKLADLINCYSLENGSDTPDFILSQYLTACLANFDVITNMRTAYYKAPTVDDYGSPTPPLPASTIAKTTTGSLLENGLHPPTTFVGTKVEGAIENWGGHAVALGNDPIMIAPNAFLDNGVNITLSRDVSFREPPLNSEGEE